MKKSQRLLRKIEQIAAKSIAYRIYNDEICDFRSSDSTKYGTNKSSGASVTSGKHLKNQTTYGAHDSVSNGKPPMHPNHHHNIHNHRTTTTSIPVHSSNNRLINNTVFHNNQYTFSLNRYDDSGYLESTGPLSSASLYGDGQKVSRGTKSDIGVPIRRPSAKAMLNNYSDVHYNRNKNNKLPPVKSDFLLSYLNNNHNDSNSANAAKNHANNQSDHRCNLNNNSESNDCTNSSAYHISGISTSDFSETYKTGAKYFYSKTNTSTNSNANSNSNPSTHSNSYSHSHSSFPQNSNSSKVELNDHADRSINNPSRTINQHQRNRIISYENHSHGSASADAKNNTSFASGSYENHQTANVVGPLLYIDPTSEPPSNSSNQTMNDTQNHSFKSVSK